MTEVSWSEWLDYSQEQITKIPEDSGVYMMHAAMKILFIGNATNLRQTILESLNDACTKDAKRFKYSTTQDHEKIKTQLLKEYQEKHDGKMPKCME
jgi:excinuclease UvrABC nuclease subunit